MGLMFNTKDTQKIVSKLDNRFGGDHFQRLQVQWTAARADRIAQFTAATPRSLSRLAFRLGVFPGSKRRGQPAKRWYGFLEWLKINHAAHHGTIRTAIQAALNDANCLGVKFVAVQGAAVNAWATTVAIGGKNVRVVTLQTIEPYDIEDEGLVPNADAAEHASEKNEPDVSALDETED